MQSHQGIDPPPGISRLVPLHLESQIPNQQPTLSKLRKATDCYELHCFKFPGVGVFHSYAEFIQGLLLETDANVINFVPQPYQMQVRGRPYIPDIYVFARDRIRVLELKPRGEFDAELNTSLVAFFQQHNILFEVISNESVLEQETLALNWLPIVQVLVQAKRLGLDTSHQEQRLLERCQTCNGVRVSDVLNPGRRDRQALDEVALYRLLHQHRLEADLRTSPLDYTMELSLCT